MRFAATNLAILVLCLLSGCSFAYHSPGRPYSGTRAGLIELEKVLSCLPSAPWGVRYVAAPLGSPLVVADLIWSAALETVLLPYDLVAEPKPGGRWETAGKESCEERFPPKEAPLPAQPVPSQTPSSLFP